MAAVEEAQSLKGSVLMQPSFVTPHSVPVFLRASVMRVVAGSLLLAGIFVGCVALTVDDPKAKLSCALSCATCMVAFYHYQKLVSIREQDGTRVTLTKPGDVPMGQSPVLKTAWQELAVDAVRYSDWSITLVPLIIDLHLMVGEHTDLFQVGWSITLVVSMVFFGAFTRIGTDELVPPPKKTKGANDDFVRVAGVVTFVLSSGCLFLVLFNLLNNLEPDPSNGWAAAYSLPWIGYGIVTFVAIGWRQFESEGYPEALSIFKDVTFGALDVWSKASFAFYIGSSALGLAGIVFDF